MAKTDNTYHVLPSIGTSWTIKRPGSKPKIFSTQKQAIKAAREIVSGRREAQVVVHRKNGKFTTKVVRGLPVVQKPPKKSSLGSARIAKAISVTLQKRLAEA